MTNWVLTGARVLVDGALCPADLPITGGLIASGPAPDARRLDLSGLWLLPGIVDVHGDAFERIVMPRPGVFFPMPLALAEADRQMLANGITTAFHGLTVSWEAGLRGIHAARRFVAALDRADLACDTRINFRWENFALDEADELAGWLPRYPGAIFSVNDHTLPHLHLPPSSPKIRRMAERAGVAAGECHALLARMAERQAEVPAATARMTQAARDAGLVSFAHDETSAQMRRDNRDMGVVVTEFPMNEPTAQAARQAGEHVVFGAPNVLRGGSHNGSISAGPAIASGLGTVLASDYYYPAQLQAAFILTEDHGMGFGAAWASVSENAAAAAGLSDRGRLAPGMRGDVIAVCPATRRVRAVFVRGKQRLRVD